MSGPEKKIQTAVIEWVERTYGEQVVCRKISTGRLGHINGWEDYEILHEGGAIHIEFKAPGGKPTPLQQHRHDQMRKAGHDVLVINDTETGKVRIQGTLGLADIQPIKRRQHDPGSHAGRDREAHCSGQREGPTCQGGRGSRRRAQAGV